MREHAGGYPHGAQPRDARSRKETVEVGRRPPREWMIWSVIQAAAGLAQIDLGAGEAGAQRLRLGAQLG